MTERLSQQPTSTDPFSLLSCSGLTKYSSGSAATSWTILPSGGLEALQTFIFNLTTPGPNPDRQEAPHPHEVILDPTGTFIVVPDLGADLLRIFSIDPKTSLLTESIPFHVPAGSGPRHGTFLKTESGKMFFFLISELANTIASYEVEYYGHGLNFTNVFSSGIYGNRTIPDGAAAAEAILSVSPPFCTDRVRMLIENFSRITNSSSLRLATQRSLNSPISTR